MSNEYLRVVIHVLGAYTYLVFNCRVPHGNHTRPPIGWRHEQHTPRAIKLIL